MTQSNVIAGSLVLAFVIFVVVRGELPCYFQVLGVATDAACPKGTVSSSGLTGPTVAPKPTPTVGTVLANSGNLVGTSDPGVGTIISLDPFGGFAGFFG